MDLSYGSEIEAFRSEVKAFLKASWPPKGDAAKGSREEQVRRFRELAISKGYLARSIPKKYGGSEQAPDPLEGPGHPRGVLPLPAPRRRRAGSAR